MYVYNFPEIKTSELRITENHFWDSNRELIPMR